MIGQTISHYKILEKLGEGGMGIVYKAQDTKLDRLVALKFLPPHLASNEPEEARFMQEAKAAAALNHPNICAIYSFGEHEGRTFIEMEYVEGKTIRHLAADSPNRELPVAKAIAYAIQIGEALQEAHSKGIVHRDIKADNIMVNTKGQTKVMDFGLAKLKGSLKLTRTSSTIGTLAYMAPEQIQGGEVDARSDIFSFGIVLFEMLAGRTPFKGEHEASIMYSIVNEEPEQIEKFRTDIPEDLPRIIRRSLEKDPEDRYQSIADMVSELRRTQKQSTRVVRPVTAEMPVSRSTGTIQQQSSPTQPIPTQGGISKRIIMIAVVVAVVVIGVGIAGYSLLNRQQTIDSLAVLPFENVGASADQEYLSDGVTENIINNLTKIGSLRVVPRSTVFRFKGKDLDPQDVGTKLKVTAVLTGRITRHGDAMDVQVDLINIKNESQIWGNSYQSSVAGIISLQDQITKDVSSKLGQVSSSDQNPALTKHSTENTAAYQLYLQGRYFWGKRSAVTIAKAVDYFKQAIALDSNYALAYAGLADCYIIQSQYAGLSTKITLPLTEEAARHALALDNSMGEAHVTLAFCYFSQWKYDEAEKEFKQALILNPKYPTAYHWYCIFLARTGRPDEAEKIIQQGHELDPLSPVITLNVGIAPMMRGKYADAVEVFKKAVDVDPAFASGYQYMGIAYDRLNNIPEATANLEKALELSNRAAEEIGFLGNFYAKRGMKDKALALLKENQQRYAAGTGAAFNVAIIYDGLGDKENALKWLEQDVADRSTWTTSYNLPFFLEDLRSEPRFHALLKTIGIDK